MIFTREPIIETVVTPKEGYRLVVRNSKGTGQEEFFVDAVEVVSFGKASFFRSLEKPKCFLVPVSDYEILEVRESRMVLKTTGTERGIKIAGGRESPLKVAKQELIIEEEVEEVPIEDQRIDKRRDRRRVRKKRGKEESDEISEQETPKSEERKPERHSLIPPPSTLISENLSRNKTTPLTEEPPPREKNLYPSPLVIGEPEPEEEIPF